MTKTKESSVYLNFIYKNLLLILGLGLIVAAISSYYFSKQPVVFHNLETFEFPVNSQDLSQTMILVDQTVAKLRTSQVEDLLVQNLSDPTLKINSYKSGPLLITVEVSSTSEESVNTASKNLDQYMKNNFNLLPLGKSAQSMEKPKTTLFTILGFGLGNFLGLILSLIKTYFKNY